jgi:Lysozyme like domain
MPARPLARQLQAATLAYAAAYRKEHAMTNPPGGLRPVSVYTRPGFYPGPGVLAAAAVNAGFSHAVTCPPVTDVKGNAWTPSELQVILAIAGAESSGNCWAYHANTSDGSMDHGPWQVNDRAHPEFFTGAGQYVTAYNPWDAAAMAWSIYVAAGRKFTPWMGYSGPGAHWLSWRDQQRDETWLEWAANGISTMTTLRAAGQDLRTIASVSLDEPA